MSEQPDLSTLPKRMRYAASVLEEVVKHADLSADTDWTPQLLRGDADIWERDALVEELARHVYQSYVDVVPKAEPWDSAHEGRRNHSRVLAKSLIEKGWRQGDPE